MFETSHVRFVLTTPKTTTTGNVSSMVPRAEIRRVKTVARSEVGTRRSKDSVSEIRIKLSNIESLILPTSCNWPKVEVRRFGHPMTTRVDFLWSPSLQTRSRGSRGDRSRHDGRSPEAKRFLVEPETWASRLPVLGLSVAQDSRLDSRLFKSVSVYTVSFSDLPIHHWSVWFQDALLYIGYK